MGVLSDWHQPPRCQRQANVVTGPVKEKTPPRLQRLDMCGLIAIRGELMARYSGGSSEVEPPMPELSIAWSELVVRERHWRSRAAGCGTLTNRPIAQGNKRMALATTVTYLEMNGFTWECGEVEETAMMLQAAPKEIKEDEWEAWVVRNVEKKE